MHVEILRESGDNYIYLTVCDDAQAAVIDPAAAASALRAADRLGVEITAVMVTHHHFDHCLGNIFYSLDVIAEANVLVRSMNPRLSVTYPHAGNRRYT